MKTSSTTFDLTNLDSNPRAISTNDLKDTKKFGKMPDGRFTQAPTAPRRRFIQRENSHVNIQELTYLLNREAENQNKELKNENTFQNESSQRLLEKSDKGSPYKGFLSALPIFCLAAFILITEVKRGRSTVDLL